MKIGEEKRFNGKGYGQMKKNKYKEYSIKTFGKHRF